MRPVWEVLLWSALFACMLALATGLCLASRMGTQTENQMEFKAQQFMSMERFDVVTDFMSAAAGHFSNDSAFENDDNKLLEAFVFGSCAVSLCCHIIEMGIYCNPAVARAKVSRHLLPLLQLVHFVSRGRPPGGAGR